MAWDGGEGLVERFGTVTGFLKQVRGHWKLGSSYEGWVKAMGREGPRLLPLVFARLRGEMQKLKQGLPQPSRWQTFAVDGSNVTCPRTLVNQEAMGDKGKPDGMPLSAITVLFDLQLGLPWAFRVGAGSDSERGHLREMLEELPASSLLVADAGFIGYDLCRRMLESGQHFLLRVGGNVTLLTELGYDHEIQGKTVYLWPQEQQRKGEPPLVLRMIKIQDADKQPVYLVTDVQDETEFSDNEAKECYRLRWGEEVFYRTTKQIFEFHTLRSRTPDNCYQEMTWAVIGIWLLGLLTIKELQAAGHPPADWSPAASRKVVRRVLANKRPDRRSRRGLRRTLARCLKDKYQRKGSKASRDYPRKKKHTTPQPPKIKPPTAAQREKAQRITPLQTAA